MNVILDNADILYNDDASLIAKAFPSPCIRDLYDFKYTLTYPIYIESNIKVS